VALVEKFTIRPHYLCSVATWSFINLPLMYRSCNSILRCFCLQKSSRNCCKVLLSPYNVTHKHIRTLA